MQPIILASQSPRRKQLLEWAEIPFEIIVETTEENYPSHLSIEEVPVYIARQKAEIVKQKLKTTYPLEYSDKTIVAADTIVVVDNRIIGKPANREEAINILQSLSGVAHKVITGVVILNKYNQTSFYDITEVQFHPLTKNQIEFYIDKYQPYDKAGAYAIQEWIGVIGIQSIKGDFYNVMGLPISKVVQVLVSFK